MTAHPPYRFAAFAAFYALKHETGESGRSIRGWLAEKMGIEERYLIIADMDETECITVEAECRERLKLIQGRRDKRARK